MAIIAYDTEVAKTLNLFPTQYLILKLIYQNRNEFNLYDGTLKELGEILDLDTGSVSKIQKKLVKLGIITKTRRGTISIPQNILDVLD